MVIFGALVVVLIGPLTALFVSLILPPIRNEVSGYFNELRFERRKRKIEDDDFFTEMVEESHSRIRPFESNYMERKKK